MNEGSGREHLVLTVTPEGFGTHGASTYCLYKAIRINEVSLTTLTGPLMRLLLEGDKQASMPTKGDSVKLSSIDSKHHTIAFLTSNIPSLEEFEKIKKETGHRASWTSADFKRNLSLDGGRVGGQFLSETKVPEILRKELYHCPRCGARLIRWWIKKFLLSKHTQLIFSKEDIWQDSDSETEDNMENVDENTDFWEVMRINPDTLEHQQQLESQARASKRSQSIRLEGDEIEQYLEFKQHQAEERNRRLSLTSSSTTTPPKEVFSPN